MTTPTRVTHTYLIPRFLEPDMYRALDIARDMFIYAHGGPSDHPAIWDRGIMAMPESELAALGLSGRYWRATIETRYIKTKGTE